MFTVSVLISLSGADPGNFKGRGPAVFFSKRGGGGQPSGAICIANKQNLLKSAGVYCTGGGGIAVVGLQDQNGLFLKIERDMPWFSVQEEDHCLEIHPLDDNFSAVSGESESPEQTELHG